MAAVPPRSTAPDDDARLPWLDAAAPGRAAVADGGEPSPAPPHGGRSALGWLIGLFLIGLLAAGAFQLGRKVDQSARSVSPPPLATTPLAPARAAPPAIVAQAAPAASPAAPALVRADAENARSEHRSAADKPVLHLRPEQLRDVRRIARAARIEVHRNAVPRAAQVAFSPRVGPPGRVIQLGAYRSAADAERAAVLFRYKYRGLLAPVPKAVLPFRPKNSHRMFYRVQFIVPSQAYAEVTCQRLRAAAKTCIVLY